MGQDYATLKGITDIGRPTLETQLALNLVDYFDWGFLGIGSFVNITRGTSGAYGGDASFLQPVHDPNFTDGQVYQSFRKNWVWQSGVYYSVQPLQVSGVYVNSVFLPLNSTGISYNINYILGQVVFNQPLPPSSVVQCEYSYKYVDFETSDVPWFRQVQFNSLRIDDPAFQQFGSGAWNTPARSRIQLPAVIVEIGPQTNQRGLMIGGGQYVTKTVLFHVFAETAPNYKSIKDVLEAQSLKTFYMYDRWLMAASNAFPLSFQGYLNSGALCYPDLLQPPPVGFRWRQCFFKKITGQDTEENIYFHKGVVRAEVEITVPEY